MCINIGGEKVFLEEVEEVFKCYDVVDDCFVVGVFDDWFGEWVVVVVCYWKGMFVGEEDLIEFLKFYLFGYKLLWIVLFVD